MSERIHYLIREPETRLVVTIRSLESGASVIDCSHVRHSIPHSIAHADSSIEAGIHVGDGAMPLARSDPVI